MSFQATLSFHITRTTSSSPFTPPLTPTHPREPVSGSVTKSLRRSPSYLRTLAKEGLREPPNPPDPPDLPLMEYAANIVPLPHRLFYPSPETLSPPCLPRVLTATSSLPPSLEAPHTTTTPPVPSPPSPHAPVTDLVVHLKAGFLIHLYIHKLLLINYCSNNIFPLLGVSERCRIDVWFVCLRCLVALYAYIGYVLILPCSKLVTQACVVAMGLVFHELSNSYYRASYSSPSSPLHLPSLSHSPILIPLGHTSVAPLHSFIAICGNSKVVTRTCVVAMGLVFHELSNSYYRVSYPSPSSPLHLPSLSHSPILIHGSGSYHFISSALMTEALALKSALAAASLARIQHLNMFLDAQVLVNLLTSNGTSTELKSILYDIHCLSVTFESIMFFHIPRSANVHADSMAKAELASSVPLAL